MAEVHVHEGESQVDAVVGDTVVVQLVEPGATGFQWVTEIDGDAVEEAFSTVQVPEGVAPGQAATRTVGLSAVRAGRSDVRLELRRVWEVADAVERVQLAVLVSD